MWRFKVYVFEGTKIFTLLFGLDVKLGFFCFLNEGIVLLNSCRFG